MTRVISVRLPNPLVQRLDRLGDWHTTHRRRPTTRNAAMRNAGRDWLDQQEQLPGLLDPQVLRQQFQAAYDSLRPPPDGVPIQRLRRLLRWPRERFDTVLEALRAAQAVALDALPEPACDDPATHDSYHGHGQCYDRLRWRAGAGLLCHRRPPLVRQPWPAALASRWPPRSKSSPHCPTLLTPAGATPPEVPWPWRCCGAACPGGAAGRLHQCCSIPILTHPRCSCSDPTQYRYELIRPLLLWPERTAPQRAQATGPHPDTVSRLKRRFDQQGMLSLVPHTLAGLPARRPLRMPDTVVHELQRRQGLYAGFGARELARIIFHTTMHRITGQTAQHLWDRRPPATPPPRPLLDYHRHPERAQARPVLLWVAGEDLRAVSAHVLGAEYSCHYDLRTGTVTRLRLGQWDPSPFAARQPQGALLERTPQDSMLVSRPPAVRRPAMGRLRAEQLGLLAAPQSAYRRSRPVPLVDCRRTYAASCVDTYHYPM